MTHPEDKITWPDGETCLRCELSTYSHKSDDYQVTPYRDPSDTLAELRKQIEKGTSFATDQVALNGVTWDYVKLRILVERAIIRKVATIYCKSGAPLRYSDGESPYTNHETVESFMAEIGACEEERMQVKVGEEYLSIWLIYGNTGYDVIADMASALVEDASWKPVEEEISHFEDVMNLL